MQEKMCKHLCHLIACYNELETEEWYHYYMGYILAMNDIGITVEIFRNEFVYCNGTVYRVEDYKDA